ncbi:MAG: PhzF family phenazine biosynthesis protein [Bacillota bacterium]
MKTVIYQVDAFTTQMFGGNPAAVCPLADWLDDSLMQSIAYENNLSETAFFVKKNDGYHIRWFTPLAEVDLCGHATLASAFVIFNYLDIEEQQITFHSNSGTLKAMNAADGITLDFPVCVLNDDDTEKDIISRGLGFAPVKVFSGIDYVVVMPTESDVRRCQPDFGVLKGLATRGVVITAVGEDCDFVSRFFAPNIGIDEDPVTGSAHCMLAPYWSEKLGRKRLNAKQLSKRGGTLLCTVRGDRVLITGQAVLYMIGEINLCGVN